MFGRVPQRIAEELRSLRQAVRGSQPDWVAQRVQQNYLAGNFQSNQLLLEQRYRSMRDRGEQLPRLDQVEFRCFSQNGEDGIIHYVFSLVGPGPKRAVEICAGDGIECNATNLVINGGWDALLVDGVEAHIERGRSFFRQCQDTFTRPPSMVHSWVTVDNVEEVLERSGYTGEVGLLSVDVDGMDYWIWEAIGNLDPRLVVVEFNPIWGPELSVAVPYDPEFVLDTTNRPFYCSASLTAFCRLARRKGLRLIGIQRLGFNAFFLRDDLGAEWLPEVSPAECFERSTVLRDWGPHWIPSPQERPDFAGAVEIP